MSLIITNIILLIITQIIMEIIIIIIKKKAAEAGQGDTIKESLEIRPKNTTNLIKAEGKAVVIIAGITGLLIIIVIIIIIVDLAGIREINKGLANLIWGII